MRTDTTTDTTGQTSNVRLPQEITRRNLVDIVLYGGLAHSKQEKELEFRVWTESGGFTGFVWAEFIVTLERMLFYLKFFRQLNEAVIASHPMA